MHLFNYATDLGLSGEIVMGTLGDRFPTFFVSDMDENGKFHKIATVEYYIKADGKPGRVSCYGYQLQYNKVTLVMFGSFKSLLIVTSSLHLFSTKSLFD